jgi:hypothetical protein
MPKKWTHYETEGVVRVVITPFQCRNNTKFVQKTITFHGLLSLSSPLRTDLGTLLCH